MQSTALSYEESGQASHMSMGVLLLAIGVFIIIYWSGYAELLRIAFPAASVMVAGLLYAFRPATYLVFLCWTWFLTPWVRRMVDYQVGYSGINPVMLTPFLVTLFTAFTLLRYRDRLFEKAYLPFTFILLAIMYAYLVGILKNGPFAATFSLLQWTVPILLGVHIMLTWHHYPAYRRAMQRTFVLSALLLGTYGIIQYVFAPPWDTQWMIDTGLKSIGHPRPYGIRVFGTLNISGVYGLAMMASVLVVLSMRTPLAWIAIAPGVGGLLLSLVRAAWGGLVIGLLFMIMRVTGPLRKQLLLVLVVGAVLSVPLMSVGFISERIDSRVETLTDIEEDNSFEARMRFYANFGRTALTSPIGNGLGGTGTSTRLSEGEVTTFDSGLMNIPYELGWPGAFLYVTGLLWILLKLLRSPLLRRDLFAITSVGIAGAIIAMLVFANHLTGVKGVVLWTFLSLALASVHYQRAMAAQTPVHRPSTPPANRYTMHSHAELPES